MEASLRNARAFLVTHSQSFASLRHLPYQPMERPTIQRSGRTSKPMAAALARAIGQGKKFTRLSPSPRSSREEGAGPADEGQHK